MPVEGEYEPSTQAWVRDQVELYEGSGGTRGTTLRDTGLPVVIVTNLGASSGKVRKTPVMRVEHDGRYAMVASKGGAPQHPVWYYNLRAHPLVELQDGPHKQDMVAREISGEERAQWWERAVAAYPPYAEYQQKTTRQIPVFVLEPVGESGRRPAQASEAASGGRDGSAVNRAHAGNDRLLDAHPDRSGVRSRLEGEGGERGAALAGRVDAQVRRRVDRVASGFGGDHGVVIGQQRVRGRAGREVHDVRAAQAAPARRAAQLVPVAAQRGDTRVAIQVA